MNEVTLTKSDFRSISDRAQRIWQDSDSRKHGHDNFLAVCYEEAIRSYYASKGWITKCGKIYEGNESS